MNEPKRRGRPPKAERESGPLEMTPARVAISAMANEVMEVTLRQSAQAYALRVWSGQSVSLPRNERIRRCKAAIEGQNLPTEGIEYPE